ncbi:30S ribosomal protein S20 [bacterium]|nr:30S ribosomal protein S20 [bacterium]MBO6042576.1 30S ribosomal protein S20 [bacterium]
MANIKSNIKSTKKDKKTHIENHSKISTLKTKVKQANSKKTQESLSAVDSYADNLETKGIIHKNKAARIKSRTAIRINKEVKAN